MRLEAFGDGAWRARLPEETTIAGARAILEALRTTPGVVDVVVSEQHLMVVPSSMSGEVAEVVRATVDRAIAGASPTASPREHRVSVHYDGADLDDIARGLQIPIRDVVSLHAAATYQVTAIGFLPGFAYLRGLDPRLVLPRRTTPRTRVPAHSVAIAGPYTGIYPFASPGGWHLLGVAEGFSPFEAHRGAVWTIGDRVVFEALA